MSRRQYRWFSSGLWQSQSGNAIFALLNLPNSGKRVIVHSIEIFNHKTGSGSYYPIIDVVVGSTTRTDSVLGGERVPIASFDTNYPLPSGITARKNTAVEASSSRFLRQVSVRLTTSSAWLSSAYGPNPFRYRNNGRGSWFIESRSSDGMDPITLNPGQFLSVTDLTTAVTNQDGVPYEVIVIFNVNGHTYSCDAVPCFSSYNGTAGFVLLNNSSYPLYIKRFFIKEVGTADTPYFQVVPVGSVNPSSFGDNVRIVQGVPVDSAYGPPVSGDPIIVLDTPMIPYLVPHQYLADASGGSPKGVNYLHTKDFWGPTYGVMFPEFLTISAGLTLGGLAWSYKARKFFDSKFNLTLNEGEGIALVSSAETAVTTAAIGTSGWQPYDFGLQYSVEPKNIPVIRATGMAVGSRWAIQKASTGELVAQGVTTDGTMEYTYYGDDVPLSMIFKVRKASSSPRYKPYETQFYLTADGITIPVSQVLDE